MRKKLIIFFFFTVEVSEHIFLDIKYISTIAVDKKKISEFEAKMMSLEGNNKSSIPKKVPQIISILEKNKIYINNENFMDFLNLFNNNFSQSFLWFIYIIYNYLQFILFNVYFYTHIYAIKLLVNLLCLFTNKIADLNEFVFIINIIKNIFLQFPKKEQINRCISYFFYTYFHQITMYKDVMYFDIQIPDHTRIDAKKKEQIILKIFTNILQQIFNSLFYFDIISLVLSKIIPIPYFDFPNKICILIDYIPFNFIHNIIQHIRLSFLEKLLVQLIIYNYIIPLISYVFTKIFFVFFVITQYNNKFFIFVHDILYNIYFFLLNIPARNVIFLFTFNVIEILRKICCYIPILNTGVNIIYKTLKIFNQSVEDKNIHIIDVKNNDILYFLQKDERIFLKLEKMFILLNESLNEYIYRDGNFNENLYNNEHGLFLTTQFTTYNDINGLIEKFIQQLLSEKDSKYVNNLFIHKNISLFSIKNHKKTNNEYLMNVFKKYYSFLRKNSSTTILSSNILHVHMIFSIYILVSEENRQKIFQTINSDTNLIFRNKILELLTSTSPTDIMNLMFYVKHQNVQFNTPKHDLHSLDIDNYNFCFLEIEKFFHSLWKIKQPYINKNIILFIIFIFILNINPTEIKNFIFLLLKNIKIFFQNSRKSITIMKKY